MTLSKLLIIFEILILTGCSSKEIVYKDRMVEVLVPQKCMPPLVFCDFNRTTDTEVVGSLLECIVDLKRNSELCR